MAILVCAVVAGGRFCSVLSLRSFHQVNRPRTVIWKTTMHSIWAWMWFVLVKVSLQVSDGRQWNNDPDYMNLAIGIHYASPTNTQPPEKVIRTIKSLVGKLTINEKYTSVAIVEMGADAKLLLTLQEGSNKTKVEKACDKIGRGSYQSGTGTMADVVRKIRSTINWSPNLYRAYMPQVVVVFWEVGGNAASKQLLVNEAYGTVKDGGGFVFLNHFRGGDLMETMVVFPILGGNKAQYEKKLASNSWDKVATEASNAIKDSVRMCGYYWNPGHCYWHSVHGCVLNATIEAKFYNGTEGEPWNDLKWYCPKNETIYPCKASKCPKTTTISTTTTRESSTSKTTSGTSAASTKKTMTTMANKPAITDRGEDDSSKVELGVGIACAIIIPTGIVIGVLLAFNRKKKGSISEKGSVSDKKDKQAISKKSTKNTTSQSGTQPAEVSQTPPNLIGKQNKQEEVKM